MRPPGYRYDGTFLSELAAAGRERITVACRDCDRRGTYRLSTLIATHGDVVLPDVLGRISADCPRRRDVRVMPGCQAIFSDAVTLTEEKIIDLMKKAASDHQ